MPCYYTGSAEGDRALAAQEAKEELQRIITATAQVACEIGKLLTPAQRAKLSRKTITIANDDTKTNFAKVKRWFTKAIQMAKKNGD